MKKMKNKKEHDYLSTSLWYREKITDPYQVIAALFAAADLAHHRKYIKAILKAASSNHSWKGNAGDLLQNFKWIESLINAAYLINKEKKKSALHITADDFFHKNLFCNGNGNAWECFPRSLSMKEYIDPYIAFKRFFKYLELSEWKKELIELLDYTTTNMSLSEAGVEIDTLTLYFHLTKLVEAAHLIDVREVTHVGGRMKSRVG